MPTDAASMKKVGNLVRELREKRNYSVEELAGIVLMKKEKLEEIEDGRAMPDSMTLLLLGQALNAYPDKLRQGEHVPQKSESDFLRISQEILNYMESIQEDNRSINEFIRSLPTEPGKDYGKETGTAPERTEAETEKPSKNKVGKYRSPSL